MLRKVFGSLSIMISILLFEAVSVYAYDGEIPLDNSYVEGVITLSELNGLEPNDTLRVYSFQLGEPGNIELHLITHAESMGMEIRDVDENIIEAGWIYSSSSPYDYKYILEQGQYTLQLLKGYDERCVGDYKFKIKFDPINTGMKMEDFQDISLYEVYTDYFTSKKDSSTVDKKYNFKITENGEYFLNVDSKINLSCTIRDSDENVLVEDYVYVDDKYNHSLTLPEGNYTLAVASSESGEFTFDISGSGKESKEVNSNDPSPESESDSEDAEKENSEQPEKEESFFDKHFSPSTFRGAILITVVGGVIVGLILHYLKKDK